MDAEMCVCVCSALLGQYTTLSNFNNYFQPLDYTEAEKRVSGVRVVRKRDGTLTRGHA